MRYHCKVGFKDEQYFGAQATHAYVAVNVGRARGELPEKESTKAAALLALVNSPRSTSFLDVGCSAGHLLRSLTSAGLPIQRYVGVDLDLPAIEAANAYWPRVSAVDAQFIHASASQIPLEDKSVDVSVSLNVLEHMKSVRPSLDELIRVTRDLVIIRTSVWRQTYIIQEVRNARSWSGINTAYAALPDSAEELSHDGEPSAFVYQNMWGEEYLAAQITDLDPRARVVIEEDHLFSSEAIATDTRLTKLPNAAVVVDGKQVVGPLILPHCWVLISLNGTLPAMPSRG